MNLNNLNLSQRRAVESIEGPILVFAGAGSGKTRVLTYKIAYLIEEINVPCEDILAVTFTNKAAQEMNERVSQLLSIDTSKMNVGTFHSICARILRSEIPCLGYTRDFGIYDQQDSRMLVKEVIQSLNLDIKTFSPNSYQYLISDKKNKMLSPEHIIEEADGYLDEKLGEIYSEYQSLLKRNNALDFDDLLLFPITIFNSFPDKLKYYQSRYKYVLVDEYQDTNRPQFEFINLLSKIHRNICVVGDDDQSIYGWRGADINNILNFSSSFNDSTIIKLEQNYRSTKIILKAAHSVVSQNEKRSDKELWTENDLGDKINSYHCYDERDEAKQIINSITNEKVKFKFSDNVILYRTNAQSRSIEDQLRREGIPYQIIGGVKFYDRKEVKDVLAYLRLIVNPSDSVSFSRIINFPPRGLGKTSTDKFMKFSKSKNSDFLKSIDKIDELDIGLKQKESFKEFGNMIESLKLKANKSDAIDIVTELVSEIQLNEFYLNQSDLESKERWKNVSELLNSISEFSDNATDTSLCMFLEEVSLLTDIDRYNKSNDSITLMTIHSAKGLEYPLVHIAGLEEGLFPLGSLSNPDVDLEEERRLFYVAVTRGEKKVFIYNASIRRRFGGEPIATIKSQFIDEIPKDLIEFKNKFDRNLNNTFSNKKSIDINNVSDRSRTSTMQNNQFSHGDIIKHSIFGKGKILSLEGSGDNTKLTILFSGNIKKTLIKKYANLTKIT